MPKAELIELRDSLTLFVREKAKVGEFSSREIAVDFISNNKSLILKNDSYLYESALIQMISQVSKRKSGRSVRPNQADLFGEFNIPLVVTIPNNASSRSRQNRVDFLKLTRIELEAWIARHIKTTNAQADEVLEVTRLFAKIDSYLKSDVTVEQAWQAWQTSEKEREA